MLSSRAIAIAVGLTLAAALGCTSSTGPDDSGSRAIAVISGGSATGEALTVAEPIVVEIRDASGTPVSGVRVAFSASTAGDPGLIYGTLFVCASEMVTCAWYSDGGSYSITNFAHVVTGADGRASAAVQFGIAAGKGTLTITVPSLGASRNITYTTVPGPLSRIIGTLDTAVYSGVTYTLNARAADRVGNPRSEIVVAASATPGIVTTSANRATAVATGRGRIVLQAGSIVDTAFVSVIPHGRLAAVDWSPNGTSLTLLDTDGSGRRLVGVILPNNGNTAPVWVPNGRELVFQSMTAGNPDGYLRAIDTTGVQRIVIDNSGEFSELREPAIALATGRLYFRAHSRTTDIWGVYSSNTDGSNAAFLAPGLEPAPAPDGQRVAYIVGTDLYVRDVAAGTSTLIASSAQLPAWSPDGTNIAYNTVGLESIRVVAADGSGDRVLVRGFHDYLSWSPDGRWLAVSRYGGGLVLISVADGAVLPVPGAGVLTQFAWRP